MIHHICALKPLKRCMTNVSYYYEFAKYISNAVDEFHIFLYVTFIWKLWIRWISDISWILVDIHCIY
jgi:hypothetical protein